MHVDMIARARTNGPYYTEGYGPSRYLLRLPGEDKAKGRTRATTFVKTIEDDTALKPWLGTMAITGVLKSSAVRTAWSALLTRHPDPWYAGDEPKAECRQLVEQAQEAGGAGERRDTGTGLHDILEAVVTGNATVADVPDEWRPHVEAAVGLLEREGFEIVPDLCEVTLLNQRYGLDVVGRVDIGGLRNRATGKLHIGDWKTGGATWRSRKNWKTKAHEAWVDGYELSDLGHSMQMALYAGAEHVVIWPENKWDACELIPMADVDQNEAVIIHVPSTEPANASLRFLDLNIGREGLELSARVRTIRRARPLLRRVGAVPPDAVQAPSSLRAELEARLRALIAAHPDAGQTVARDWPADVPTFKGSADHTVAQLEAIGRVVSQVEADHRMPFTVPPAGCEPPAPATPATPAAPAWTAPDEGDRIDDATYEAIKAEAATAPPIIDQWHAEAMDARRPFTLKGARTQRRAAIITAAIAAAEHLHDPAGTDLLDAALLAVAGIDRQTGMTVGAALGSLAIDEAEHLATLARAFGAGLVQPTTDDTGAYRFAA